MEQLTIRNYHMNAAERTLATYGFGKVDHLMRKEFYIWEETKARWRTEGWNGDEACFLYDDDKGLGWHDGIIRQPSLMDSAMYPLFEETILEITDKYNYSGDEGVMRPLINEGVDVPSYFQIGQWPSVEMAIDYLAWGFFLGMAFICAA